MNPPGVLRILAAQVLIHSCMTGTRLAVPLIGLETGMGKGSIGVLLAMFAASQVLLSLPAGRYADARGARRPLAAAVALAVCGVLLAAAMPVFGTLLVAALATGAATVVSMVALQQQAGRLARDAGELKNVYSWMSAGPPLANALGPLAAGGLIDAVGFRATFALMALLPLASLAVGWKLTSTHPRLARASSGEKHHWSDLLSGSRMRKLLFLGWLCSACWEVHSFIIPMLGHERGLSASLIGTILGGFAFAAAIARFLLPALGNRVREHAVVAGMMAAVTVLFAIYPLLYATWAMMCVSALLGFALGCGQPMLTALMMQSTPAHRFGEAIGLRMLLTNSSNAMMPALLGAAAALMGVASLLWIAAVCSAGGAPAAWRLGRHGHGGGADP